MAFLYDDDPGGIFRVLGPFISYIGAHLPRAEADLPAELEVIREPVEDANYTDVVKDLYPYYQGLQNNETAICNGLSGFAANLLRRRQNVLEELGTPSGSLADVLPALYRRMLADSETVKRCVATIGSVTAGATNMGDGTVLVTKKLDGYNPPVRGGLSIPEYAGVDSELCCAETMTVECLADSSRDGLEAGGEAFGWRGALESPGYDWHAPGSGIGPGVTAAGGVTLLTNGDFEAFDAAGPSGWTVAGAFGTTAQQTTTAGQFYRGSSGLKLTGNGATAALGVTQALPEGTLVARRLYCLTARVKASGVPASGSIDLLLTGTGYTPGSGESVTIAAGSFPTSWTLIHAFIVMPQVVPTDMAVVARVSGTLSNGVSVYVDDVFLVEPDYHGGVAVAVVPGASRFAVGDSFTFALSQTAANFQDWFRRALRVQLPSASSPTISDALAAAPETGGGGGGGGMPFWSPFG